MVSDPLRRLTEDLQDAETHIHELSAAQLEELVLALARILERMPPLRETTELQLVMRSPQAPSEVGLAELKSGSRQSSSSPKVRVSVESALIDAVQERFGRPPISRTEVVELALNELLRRIGSPEGYVSPGNGSSKSTVFSSGEEFLAALESR